MFNKDYNLLVKLFHYSILGNKIVPELLFDLENLFNKKKQKKIQINHHLYVTGLARAGTTILLNTIYSSKKFASYTYRDMPFVISPNLWGLFSKYLKNKKSILRKHKDNIMINLDSPEQFEEIFWNLKDSEKYNFKNSLNQYSVENLNLNLYELFIKNCLIKYKKNNYLSKNNNSFLRIKSLIKRFPKAKFLLSIRNPLDHSISLFNQHKNFLDIQKKDKFTKSYMNYLVHHEFGSNHKPMDFKFNTKSNFKPDNINYWLDQWINFYKFSKVENLKENKNIRVIDYEDLCTNSDISLKEISKFIGENIFENITLENFKLKKYDKGNYGFNIQKEKESLEIYKYFVS